ncbi:hypothetical protein HY488_00780 [Candidatus Woesearchaeota archaeon]|nr:hypothetical protein [Candidatus Woesearchaeota archaeon]
MKRKYIPTSIPTIVMLILLICVIALTACSKRAVIEVSEESEQGEENASLPIEEPAVPAPQATDVFPEPEEQLVVPNEEQESGVPQEIASAPQEIQSVLESEAPTTTQLVDQTQQLVEKSQRLFPEFKPGLLVHFLDVGYGDSTLIQTPKGENILIDCGDYPSGRMVVNYLAEAGVDQLDMLVLSSPAKEHVGGCDYVLQYFYVDNLYDNGLEGETKEYKLFLSTVEDNGIHRVSLHGTISLDLDDGVRAKILTPYHGRNFISNTKDNSLLFKLDYGDVGFLIAGDCRKGCERELLEYYKPEDLSATIYRVGDHGSEDAATELFLDAVLPQISVVSTQTDPSKETPSQDMLARLKKYGSRIFRTDYDGNVLIKTDGKEYAIDISSGIEHKDLSGQQNTTRTASYDCPFVAHQYSNLFYPLECTLTPNIEPENRLCFADEDEAFGAGFVRYTKC